IEYMYDPISSTQPPKLTNRADTTRPTKSETSCGTAKSKPGKPGAKRQSSKPLPISPRSSPSLTSRDATETSTVPSSTGSAPMTAPAPTTDPNTDLGTQPPGDSPPGASVPHPTVGNKKR